MNENKQEICAKLGELLKLTRAGADIDRIEYDSENNRAVLYRTDRGYPYRMRLKIASDSGIALIRNIIGIL